MCHRFASLFPISHDIYFTYQRPGHHIKFHISLTLCIKSKIRTYYFNTLDKNDFSNAFDL